MWDSLRALGRRLNWWLGLAGNMSLVYVVIFGGAAATVITTVAAYAVSFLDWLSGVPLFFRLMFFASVFVLSFALVNHAWQRLAAWRNHTNTPTPRVRTARAVSTQDEAVGKMRRDPLQVEEETDEEFLIRRCRQLANELHEFLKERGHGEGVEVDDPGDPKMVQRSNETVGLYRTRFEGEILARYEVLKERGWWGDELLDEFGRNRVENVTYYGDIRAIAQRLSAIGHRP
jgi:hypothetical protein